MHLTRKKSGKKRKTKRRTQRGRGQGQKMKTHFRKNQTQKINCSPKDKKDINDFSCYTSKSLLKLKDLWNVRHPDAKIVSTDSKEVHRMLSEHLKDICHKESCWIRQKKEFGSFTSEMTDSFAPESPKEWKKNPNEWLSSVDIMKVMKQYEKAYKCFEFIGPSPIDFDTVKWKGECVWDELCKFKLDQQIKRGKTKIGIIFNTDPHDKPGQHWISMFVNILKKRIFFFDSTGDPPPPEILAFVKKIQDQGLRLQPPLHFTFDNNEGVEHQYGNTECGIYSLFFIVHMLEDKFTGHYLKTHIIKDKYMETFRNIYFNDSL